MFGKWWRFAIGKNVRLKNNIDASLGNEIWMCVCVCEWQKYGSIYDVEGSDMKYFITCSILRVYFVGRQHFQSFTNVSNSNEDDIARHDIALWYLYRDCDIWKLHLAILCFNILSRESKLIKLEIKSKDLLNE